MDALLDHDVVTISLYDDGIEMAGADDVQVLMLPGRFTLVRAAALLAVGADQVTDERHHPR